MAISGVRVFTKKQYSPPDSAVEELANYEVAWISDALGFSLMDAGMKGVYTPPLRKVVGRALTVKTCPGDFAPVPSALNVAEPGDILVIDGRGNADRAIWGDFFTGWARAVGIAAVVIDGATRDRHGIARLEYPCYARWTTSRNPTIVGPGEVNVPVSCGGLCVMPGDLLVVDEEGVAVVPARDLERSLEALRMKAAQEDSLPRPTKENWPQFFTAMSSAAAAKAELLEQSWDVPVVDAQMSH